jgi:hypothetical protein
MRPRFSATRFTKRRQEFFGDGGIEPAVRDELMLEAVRAHDDGEGGALVSRRAEVGVIVRGFLACSRRQTSWARSGSKLQRISGENARAPRSLVIFLINRR